MAWRGLTEAQWAVVKPHLPVRKRPWRKRDRQGGRPPLDDRQCFEGILWILWTGAQWSELPPRYGSKSAVPRRLQRWTAAGTLEQLWRAFLAQLHEQDQVRWDECFVDGTFASAKKRGLKIGKTKRGKGTKLVVLVDGQGTPLGLHVDSATPSEVRLLVQTLETVRVPRAHQRGRPRTRPARLIADKGYDSNAIRKTLHHRGITPIVPARRNNTVATHQDGRVLRRYRRRWIVERTLSWLQHFRRLTTRWDRSAEVYTALAHLACALVVMKRVLG